MTDGEALANEREIVAALTDGMRTLLCHLVAVRVILEDLHTSKVVSQVETQLVSRLAPAVQAELDAQFSVILDHPHVKTPAIDWKDIVQSLVEKGKGIDLSKSPE